MNKSSPPNESKPVLAVRFLRTENPTVWRLFWPKTYYRQCRLKAVHFSTVGLNGKKSPKAEFQHYLYCVAWITSHLRVPFSFRTPFKRQTAEQTNRQNRHVRFFLGRSLDGVWQLGFFCSRLKTHLLNRFGASFDFCHNWILLFVYVTNLATVLPCRPSHYNIYRLPQGSGRHCLIMSFGDHLKTFLLFLLLLAL